MTETKLKAAPSPPSGFRFEEVSGRAAAGRTTTWTGQRESSVAAWFASLLRLGRNRLQVREEAEVRRCGHPGVLADYLSAKSRVR
jgi:hypothetical protein